MHKPCPRRSAITCPYCKYRYGDSWVFPAQGEEECENCGKNFHFSSETEVRYSTTPDCQLNGENHTYIGTVGWKECSVCGHLEEVVPSRLDIEDTRGVSKSNAYSYDYRGAEKKQIDAVCTALEIAKANQEQLSTQPPNTNGSTSCLTDVYYRHEPRQDMRSLHDAIVNGKRGWNPYASYYHNVLKEKEDRFCKTFEEGLEAYNRRTDHQE